VTIHVSPTVSVWTNGESIALDLNGSGPNNATAASDPNLAMVSNVASDLKATVSGILPTQAGGVNFFIFPNQSDAGAVVAGINSIGGIIPSNPWGTDAYAPIGALVWNPAQALAGNVSQNILSNEPPQVGSLTIPIVYAADAPGGTPGVQTTALTVTYTIAVH
jgi:hypothetical protein